MFLSEIARQRRLFASDELSVLPLMIIMSASAVVSVRMIVRDAQRTMSLSNAVS
jgi:hypothetical protein